VREALLLDLGAIIFELHRQERREPELLQAKAAALMEIDDEVRALAEALGEGHGLPQLTARGLVASCTSCGAVMGVRDRHCPSCGAAAGTPPALNGGGEEPAELEEPPDGDEIGAEAGFHAADNGDRELVDQIEDAEEVDDANAEEESSSSANGDSPADDGPPSGPEPLVPRAQRTLRAGRRLARAWLEDRRSGRE
jgi:hypothetical protein